MTQVYFTLASASLLFSQELSDTFPNVIPPSQKHKNDSFPSPPSSCFNLISQSSLLLRPLGDGSKTNSSPKFSQAKFDLSSFIGGIILVLCMQAGGFFAMRFLKSKEQSSYDPM